MKAGIFFLLLISVAASSASDAAVTIGFQELQVLHKLEVSDAYLAEQAFFLSKVKDVINNIASKFNVFRNWMQKQFKNLLEVAKPQVEILKEMALQFIKEMTKAAIEAVLEAGYEYFRERQMEIGEKLWSVIESLYRKHLEGKLTYARVENFAVQKFDRYVLDGCSVEYLLTEGFFLQSIKNVISSISSKFTSFKNWIAKQMKATWDVVQPHVDTLKQMAIVFLKEMAKVAAEAVIEAGYEYFREHQNEIGEALWRLVEDAYRKYLEGKLQYLN